MKGKKQPYRPTLDHEKLWFPTPENCQNSDNIPLLQKKINDIPELHKKKPMKLARKCRR